MMRNVLRTYIMFASRARIIFLTFLLLPTGLAEGAQPTEPKGDGQKPKTDLYGDPLPPGAIARLGTVRLRQGGQVDCLAFAPDGSTLLTAGESETAILWDVKTGKELRRFTGKTNETLPLWVPSVAFTPDGKTIFTGHFDGFRRWDLATGRQLPPLGNEPNQGHCVAVSSNGKFLAAGKNKFLAIWDLNTGRITRELEPAADSLNSVAISKDGNYVATAGFDDTLRWWDLRTGQLIHLIREKGAYFNRAEFAPDGKTLVSSGRDKTFRLWDVASGQELRKWTEHGSWVEAIAFSADGKQIASE
jgi:hypothetical protein